MNKLIKRFLEWNDGGPSYNDLHPGPAALAAAEYKRWEAEQAPPRPPEPVPATKMLRTQLERVTLAYNDRERVLVKELADREAELADIRQAREAAMSALVELEPFPDLVVTDEAPPAPIDDYPEPPWTEEERRVFYENRDAMQVAVFGGSPVGPTRFEPITATAVGGATND